MIWMGPQILKSMVQILQDDFDAVPVKSDWFEIGHTWQVRMTIQWYGNNELM